MANVTIKQVVLPSFRVAITLGFFCCAGSDNPASPAVDASTTDSFGFGPPAPDPLLPSDAAISQRVAAVFGSTCVGGPESSCHGTGAGSLYLSLARDAGDVVGVLSTERPDLFRVKPGDPEHSYLYLKVLGDGGIDGASMPPLRHDPRIPALMYDWIRDGATVP